MTPKQYFKNNKKSILKTAEFVAKRDGKRAEDVLAIIENEFLKEEGTQHKEILEFDNQTLQIDCELKNIRFLKSERIVIYLVLEEKMIPIYQNDGNQVESTFNLDDILNAITLIKIKLFWVKKFNLYVCHNHPFVYKAHPSEDDCRSLESIIQLINSMNALDPLSNVYLCDFGIVSPFDYWSFIQSHPD